MKKVTAFVGCARKRNTYNAVVQFMGNLQAMGDVEYEIVRLSDYHLEICRGCCVCFNKGEEHCPLKDDRDVLIGKMMASDGVVFATPNYSFQVSALMKVFLDRLGFAFHRPRFFGKAFTSIVAQGFYGGDKIVKYLDFVGSFLGFNTVKGSCIVTVEPIPEKQQRKNDALLAKQARQYYAKLAKSDYPVPSWFHLIIFRLTRTKTKVELDDSFRDYTYYKDQGWLESDYYYPTRLGPLKKLVGKLFDSLSASLSKA
jgi:multimeric flavodoxin WrbA